MTKILKQKRIEGCVYNATVKLIGFKEKFKTFDNRSDAIKVSEITY